MLFAKTILLGVLASFASVALAEGPVELKQPIINYIEEQSDEVDLSTWKRLEIPGAICGDGSKYPVFIQGDTSGAEKLLMILRGGGACWNQSTCTGGIYTDIKAPKSMKAKNGIFSSSTQSNPFANYAKVFFSYCNGDVFLGNHIAEYKAGTKIRHVGMKNFEKAIEYLKQRNLVDLSTTKEFVLYGYSAGAVGALYHAMDLDRQLTRATNKVLISDAPGLHFGETFWEKFSTNMTADYTAALEATGATIEKGQGNVSSVIPSLCAKLDDWTVGVLQGTRDWIMSGVFGEISKNDHKKLIFSDKGLYKHTVDATDNCSSWIPDTSKHVFLTTSSGVKMTVNGKSAMQYAWDLVKKGAGKNHADVKFCKEKKRNGNCKRRR